MVTCILRHYSKIHIVKSVDNGFGRRQTASPEPELFEPLKTDAYSEKAHTMTDLVRLKNRNAFLNQAISAEKKEQEIKNRQIRGYGEGRPRVFCSISL